MEEKQQHKTILLRPFTEIFRSSVKNHIERKGSPDITIHSIPTLNDKIFGLSRGRVVIIGGRTSQGKTSLALQLAIDAAQQGFKVRYLSLEQDEEELADRIFCNVTNVPFMTYRQDPTRYNDQLEDFHRFSLDKLKSFIVAYKVGAKLNEVEALVQDLEADLVIVDYIQAIKKLSQDKLEAINEYIIGFRESAVKNKFAGILVSQVNREAEDKRGSEPNLWNLKGSGTLEEHADTVLLCHYKYAYTKADKDRGFFKLIVAKQRQGEVGDIDLDFEAPMFKFKERRIWAQTNRLDAVPEISRVKNLFGGTVLEEVNTGDVKSEVVE